MTLTNDEIRAINLWLYDNPRYQTLTWSEAIALYFAENEREISADTAA